MNREQVEPALNAGDAERIRAPGKAAAVLGVEDANHGEGPHKHWLKKQRSGAASALERACR